MKYIYNDIIIINYSFHNYHMKLLITLNYNIIMNIKIYLIEYIMNKLTHEVNNINNIIIILLLFLVFVSRQKFG